MEGYPKAEPVENLYPEHLICRSCHEGAEVKVDVSPVNRELYCLGCLPAEYRELLEHSNE